MNIKRKVKRPYSIYSVILGVTVVLLFILDYYAIAPGSFGGGIGFLSIVFISPIGLVFGINSLKKNRLIALLGIGINSLELFYFFYSMTHFAP